VSVGGERVFFFFAHQDDEYFASPWMADELRGGNRLRCFYLTDGGDADVRDAESRRFLASLGVPQADVAFARTGGTRIPGGRLADYSRDALAAILADAAAYRPVRIYAPSYEGGHPDHDTAHLLAAALAVGTGTVEESWHFSLYNAFRCPKPFFNTLRQLPSSDASRRIARSLGDRFSLALACWRYYPSQFTSFVGLFPGAFVERVVLAREKVVRFSLPRLADRPHAGTLLYEIRFGWTYERFRAATASIAEAIGLRGGNEG